MHQVMFFCTAKPPETPINHNIYKPHIWCNYCVHLLRINSTTEIEQIVKLCRDYCEMLLTQCQPVYQFIFAIRAATTYLPSDRAASDAALQCEPLGLASPKGDLLSRTPVNLSGFSSEGFLLLHHSFHLHVFAD